MKVTLIELLVATLLISAITADSAHAAIQTFNLHHRPASTVLPQIKALLPSDAGLAADGYRLIVRGDANTIADVRAALDSLDRPLANLLIDVRQTGHAQDTGRRIGANARIGNDGVSGHLEIKGTRSQREEHARQTLRTLEGHSAHIDTGVDVPERSRWLWAGRHGRGYSEHTRYRHLPDGFYVTPSLNQGQVRLAITVQHVREAESDRRDNREIVSTVSGNLGEWITLGGVGNASREDSSGNVRRWQTSNDNLRIQVRVRRAR